MHTQSFKLSKQNKAKPMPSVQPRVFLIAIIQVTFAFAQIKNKTKLHYRLYRNSSDIISSNKLFLLRSQQTNLCNFSGNNGSRL
jgi:hypothetical protein